jgi:endonuclease YncB( thermonuclease family)
MAGPITWQSLRAPELDTRFLQQSGQSMDKAFMGMQDVLQRRAEMQAANDVQGRTNNTQDMLDQYSAPKTREEFLAQRDSLNQQASGYGANIDRAAVRAFGDNRLATLDNQFSQAAQAKAAAEAPLIDRIKFMEVTGDVAGAQALRLANPGLTDQAGTAAFGLAQGDARTARTRAVTQDGYAKQTNEIQLRADGRADTSLQMQKEAAELNRRNVNSQITARNVAANGTGAAKLSAAYQKQSKAELEYLAKNGIMNNGRASDGDNLAKFTTLIQSQYKETPQVASALSAEVARMSREGFPLKDGKKLDIPMTVLQEGFMSVKDRNADTGMWGGYFKSPNTVVGDFTEYVSKAMSDPKIQRDLGAFYMAENNFLDSQAGNLPGKQGSQTPAQRILAPGEKAPVQVTTESQANYAALKNQSVFPAPSATPAIAPSKQVTPANTKALSAAPPLGVTSTGQIPPGAKISSTTATTFDLNSGEVTPAGKPLVVPDNTKWAAPTMFSQAKGGTAGADTWVITIGGVTDGDSVKLQNKSGEKLTCRLDKIDAPETAKANKPGQPYAEESKQSLYDMLINQDLDVNVVQEAQEGVNFGRSLCQISVKGMNVNLAQVQNGMASIYKTAVLGYSPDNSVPDRNFAAAQDNALQNKIGMYQQKQVVNPAVNRAGTR